MAEPWGLRTLLKSADRSQSAEIVQLHKIDLNHLAGVITEAKNELVRSEALLQRLEIQYEQSRASIVAEVDAAKAALSEALKAFYSASNTLGIPVGEAPERA